MSIRPWFESQSGRYAWELKELQDAGLVPTVDDELAAKGALVLTVGVPVRGETVTLRVYYPPGFPEAAPQIAAPEISLAAHQTPWLTALCILAGQREWRANHSAAQLIREAMELVDASLHEPDRVRRDEVLAPEPASFYLLHHPRAGVLVPPEMQDLERFRGKWGTFDAQQVGPSLLLLSKVKFQAPTGGAPLQAPDHLTVLARATGDNVIHGAWFWIDEHPPYPLPGGTFDDALRSQYAGLIKHLESRFPDALVRARAQGRRRDEWLAVIYSDESRARGQFIAGWLLVRIQKQRQGGERFTFHRPLYWPSEDRLTGAPALDGLRRRRVAVVGCGALGSTVAIELARAGVGQLTLVDPDFLSPMNLVRHEGGFFELGLPKVDAVARRIQEQAPWTKVQASTARVGSGNIQNPAHGWAEHLQLVEELGQADLIVDTTAEPQSTGVLNALSLQLRVPLVIAWATGGAWGGRLVRIRPFSTACYECVSWSVARSSDAQPPHDPKAYRYPEGCAHPSFGGASFETKAVALAATRMCIATLAASEGYPDFGSDHYVLALRDADGQRERFWLPIATSRYEFCSSCGSEPVTDQVLTGANEFPANT